MIWSCCPLSGLLRLMLGPPDVLGSPLLPELIRLLLPPCVYSSELTSPTLSIRCLPASQHLFLLLQLLLLLLDLYFQSALHL